jgi:hypothetical protein
MLKYIIIVASCVAMLCNLVFYDVAFAGKPWPMYIIGTARLDGASVTDGTIIRVYCAGFLVGETATFTHNTAIYFALDVEGDDPDTTTRDGCREGEELSFFIGSRSAAERATWLNAGNLGSWAIPFRLTATSVTLTPTATKTPTPTTTRTSTPTLSPTVTPTRRYMLYLPLVVRW